MLSSNVRFSYEHIVRYSPRLLQALRGLMKVCAYTRVALSPYVLGSRRAGYRGGPHVQLIVRRMRHRQES